jgi:AraC-like DNA-binding protein
VLKVPAFAKRQNVSGQAKKQTSREMISTVSKPKSELEEFVVCFYYNKSDKFEYSGFANPTTNQELFFNLGDNFEINNSIGQPTQQRNWISGIQSKSLPIKSSGRHITAGVIFKPWGLYSGFRLNAKYLINKTINSKSFCDISNECDSNNLSENQFFDLIEYKLIKSINRSRMTSLMQKIIYELEQDNLTELAEKFCRSKKAVIEAYNKMIGLSPHKFNMLKCICDTISILQNNPTMKLTELAYKQGFYDQAHFIRVFKEHTGMTPKEFRNKNLTM